MANVIYHLKVDNPENRAANDKQAQAILKHEADVIQQAGGAAHVSASFGTGPAYVVVTLPDNMAPDTVLPEYTLLKVAEEVDGEIELVQRPANDQPVTQ